MVDQYIFSGSLPEEASTYVTREADGELYQGLKAGKFCYVLNSRQSGKSSLRVRTMRRLRESGVECSAIDLSAGGIQNVPPEQWYADLIDTLIESFGLDVEFGDWWEANQLNSLVTRFRKFIEEILLAEVKENIVIFIDEIDSVLSLKFPTDDFFAFIRACYNQRVDNPEYNRLTFCLLGVASPSNLISDKKRTPFNIGKAISLKGFQLDEVEPLEEGLHGRYSDSQAVMQEILHWTGGQPFLTQKLCQFIVEESEKENPRTVEQVVRSHIIENWESQDEPEHLRTIRDRILRDEQRASYLLELYQQIRVTQEESEITADETQEQSELQLSGLVVRQQNNLRVYNPIYKEIFDQNWIETQLRNLRPYSENFKFWVASGGSDDSRLLRGKALQDALEWSRDKSLNYQDREFLAASQAKEKEEAIAALEKEAALERERKDREATEKRNQVLSEANQTLTQANKKAKQQIRVGSVVLAVTLSLTGIFGILSVSLGKKVTERNDYLQTVQKLTQLAAQVQDEGSYPEAEELFSQAGSSVNIDDQNLKMDILYTGISYAIQKLKSKNLIESQKYLGKVKVNPKNDSPEELQTRVLYLKTQGSLFEEQKKQDKAVESYREAFKIWDSQNKNISPFNQKLKNRILSSKNVEALHRKLINLLDKSNADKSFQQKVRESLKKHYYAQLNNLLENKKWEAADRLTSKLMLYITKTETQGGYLDTEAIKKLSCEDLRIIDAYWKNRSDGHFGFGVQKKIWLDTGNGQEYNEKAFDKFLSQGGWDVWKYSYEQVEKDEKQAPRGLLPTSIILPISMDKWVNEGEALTNGTITTNIRIGESVESQVSRVRTLFSRTCVPTVTYKRSSPL
ncbi:AAA-like domain-containing protein [Brasilonema sp. CT11]|nr:AAA-like domain-containing protein [Brasilonema sp. CT11]